MCLGSRSHFPKQGSTAHRVCMTIQTFRRKCKPSDFLQFRGSIVVSISACHADDPGSIPGRGDSCAFNAWATCLLSSQCTFMEALQMPPRRQSPSPVARGHALGYELAVRGKVLGVGCRCAGVGRYGFSGRHKIPTLLGHTKDRIV